MVCRFKFCARKLFSRLNGGVAYRYLFYCTRYLDNSSDARALKFYRIAFHMVYPASQRNCCAIKLYPLSMAALNCSKEGGFSAYAALSVCSVVYFWATSSTGQWDSVANVHSYGETVVLGKLCCYSCHVPEQTISALVDGDADEGVFRLSPISADLLLTPFSSICVLPPGQIPPVVCLSFFNRVTHFAYVKRTTGTWELVHPTSFLLLRLSPEADPMRHSFSLSLRTYGKRPTAKELLKHPFIKKAKKNVILTELIDRYKQWKARTGSENRSDDEDGNDDAENVYEDYFSYSILRSCKL
ncbi:unnamed protein product [Soboliphyme baturini]|uniref:Protein kinase domain-containing protein n=1 Tax=Soboliphyme baturini TaxID=241478 RepID=A0A183IFT0_9BILA|nr:unnamed protein product [Soboliphyme baturini]